MLAVAFCCAYLILYLFQSFHILVKYILYKATPTAGKDTVISEWHWENQTPQGTLGMKHHPPLSTSKWTEDINVASAPGTCRRTWRGTCSGGNWGTDFPRKTPNPEAMGEIDPGTVST